MRNALLLVLVLVLAFSCQWTIKAEFWQIYYSDEPAENLTEIFLEKIPKQVRDLCADYFWLTADEYMHFGSSRRLKEGFLAGSYAGNTEILPLLELAIFLDPQHIDAYAILSQNLAMYLERFTHAIRLLQRGILSNRDSPRLHELYGNVALCYAFIESYNSAGRKNERLIATRYLDAALKSFMAWVDKGKLPPFDPVLNPQNYQILRSRFLVERGENREALSAWKKSGVDLQGSEDLLAKFLRKFEKGEPVPRLPEDLLATPTPLASGALPGVVASVGTETSVTKGSSVVPSFQENNPTFRSGPPPEKESGDHLHTDSCNHAHGTSDKRNFSQVFRQMAAQMGVFAVIIIVLNLKRRAG